MVGVFGLLRLELKLHWEDRMRTNISDRAGKELLEIMEYYGHTSTAHTLNIIIGSLHKSIFIPSLKEGKQTDEQNRPTSS